MDTDSNTIWLEILEDEIVRIHLVEPTWERGEWLPFPGVYPCVDLPLWSAEQIFGIELNTDPRRIGVLIELDPRALVVREIYPIRKRERFEEDISGMLEDSDE